MNYLEMSPTQVLKARMREFKKELRALRSDDKQAFVDFVIKNEPSYDSYTGGLRIENAWSGKTPDLRVTELMQDYITEVKSQIKKIA